jgi:hypothetical protein
VFHVHHIRVLLQMDATPVLCVRTAVPYGTRESNLHESLFHQNNQEYWRIWRINEDKKEEEADLFFPVFEEAVEQNDYVEMGRLLQLFDMYIDEPFFHIHVDGGGVGEWCYSKDAPVESDPVQMSVLYAAVISNRFSLVKWLILNGASPEGHGVYEPNNLNDTRLVPSITGAVLYGRNDMFRCLLENGADINAKDSEGQTILHHVIQGSGPRETMHINSFGWLQILISAGADVNVQDKRSDSPVSIAICRGKIPEFALMLANGADVNAEHVGYWGSTLTLLHVACLYVVYEIVVLLLEHGSNVQQKSGLILELPRIMGIQPTRTWTPKELMEEFYVVDRQDGEIDHVLFGAFEPDTGTVSKVRLDEVSRLLKFIETGLDDKRTEVEQERMSAVMMAFDPRLGNGSMLRRLDQEFVRSMILPEENTEYITPVLTRLDREKTTIKLIGVWIERRKTAIQWLTAVGL